MTTSLQIAGGESAPGGSGSRSGLTLAFRGPPVPRISRLRLAWFTWYCRRYLRRHFHSLRISRAGHPPAQGELPLVIYLNHASWWDPLVTLVIKDEWFRDRALYAPVDASMLRRYPLFGKLGCFGVERETTGAVSGGHRAAARFLRISEAILNSSDHLLAVTPQGRFVDARGRPVVFEAGLGHLAARVGRAVFQPLAMEYVFWEEKLPEILVRFGEPVLAGRDGPASRPPRDWTDLFEQQMADTQDALAREAQQRRPGDFRTILRGGGGPGGIYDLWRALVAALRGQPFRKEHGYK